MSAISLGGREQRSPTPLGIPHVPRSHPGNELKARFTDFFIETILGPEFGGSKKTSKSHRQDDDSEVGKPDRGHGAKIAAEARPLGGGENASPKIAATQWPAWVYCTRYSDRPSSGPRTRKVKRQEKKEEKRPRTAFSASQLQRLKQEFQQSNYLTEQRRRHLAKELSLSESQIKIWFQNKRAKIKKASGVKNELALKLMAQGLYNHSTVALDECNKLSKDQVANGDCSRSDYTSDSDGESLTH